MNARKISLFEIFLLIGMTFAVSYIIGQSDDSTQTVKQNINITKIILSILKSVFDVIPSVSADSAVATCINSNSGQSCQEFPAATCDSQCSGSCVPAPIDQVSECQIGTCYDPTSGICQSGSPKSLCTADGGQWSSDPYGNLPQCQQGCCVLGNNAAYTTSTECSQLASNTGIKEDFRPEVQSEVACLALAGNSNQGACVFQQNNENSCKFTTQTSCSGLGGKFYNNYLCSNPLLGTGCKPQATAKCVQGKDQIYWFDSCGNQENVYSANKVQSYDNGMVQPLNSSCSLGTSGNPLANQNTCGNCNYLTGSICGPSSGTQKLADNTIDFVCRSLSCVDSSGTTHKQGESWCSYEGSIGVDSANNRATDTVGSRQFRETCINGQITTESCGDYRTGICVQSVSNNGAASFSSAACRANTGQECLSYNLNNDMDSCTANSDCFVKHVQVSNNYKFDFCAPKYPIGSDLANDPTSAQAVCAMASQSCTVTYTKKLFGGWSCTNNCECETAAFAQQLNNLCMSVGDCGAKINYAGALSQSYKLTSTSGTPAKLDSAYLAGLIVYKNTVPGQYAEPGNSSLANGALGIPSGLGSAGQTNNDAATSFALKTGGAIGVTLAAMAYGGAYLGAGAGGTTFGAFISGAGSVLSRLPELGSLSTHVGATASSPGFAAAGGAVAGAAIGLAITALLIKTFGLENGLGSDVTNALLAAGATSGALLGYTYVAGQAATYSWVPVVGWILAVIVIVVLVIAKLLGVGKTKQITVNFQCQPWQAPTGGADCAKCGSDGLPCTRYACESLGQTCELVNEGTDQAACISNSKNDVTPPKINPLQSALQDGYSYANVSGSGFGISGPDGCLKAYTPITFGVATDEPAQCAYDSVHTNSYSDMEFNFGGSNLYTVNHTAVMTIPRLESLGLPGYDPNAEADYSLYVRCQDKNGNQNLREYTINFCVKPGDDVTPPLITRGSPTTNFLPYSATQQAASVYTNEPAECRWMNYNTDYFNMTNQFDCANNLEDQTPLGWLCNTTFPINSVNNSFYVRCLDQPWQNDTSKRNANTNSFVFNLQKTATPLIIKSVIPNSTTLTYNVSPASVTLKVQTSGGVDGTAICAADFGGGYYTPFLNTGGTIHTWTLNQFTAGAKQLNIQCKDSAGNIATASANFNILIDTTAPDITRVYASSGQLNVITNENSTCYYNQQSCIFDLNNATTLAGTGLVHTTSFDSSLDYYLKCKDTLGNVPGACSIVVRQGVIS